MPLKFKSALYQLRSFISSSCCSSFSALKVPGLSPPICLARLGSSPLLPFHAFLFRLLPDLLLILWPIFFVTASRQEPHLKVRNFKKSVVRGSERAVSSIGVSLPRPLRRMSSGRLNFSSVEEERAPAWDRERGASVRQVLDPTPVLYW